MSDSLTPTEIHSMQELVETQDAPERYEIEYALSILEKNDGHLEASFRELWQKQVGELGSYGPGDKSLWDVTLTVLRREICGDESFRSKILNYNKSPAKAPILTGAIVYLVELQPFLV